jgi:hypothetical protein
MHRPDQPGADSELINEIAGIIFNGYFNLHGIYLLRLQEYETSDYTIFQNK